MRHMQGAMNSGYLNTLQINSHCYTVIPFSNATSFIKCL